jgi:alanine racemase
MTQTHAAKRPADARATENLLTVDLTAIGNNVELLRRRSSAPLTAVVKADGFGHGAAQVARTAIDHGAVALGVTSLEEAWQLREAGLSAPVLSWLNPVDADWARACRERVTVAVGSTEHLDAVASTAERSRCRIHVHLQVDVGMSRDGAPPQQWLHLASLAARAQSRGLISVTGLMGHLGRAELPGGDPQGKAAFDRAEKVLASVGLRPPRHLAATAAVLTDPETHLDGTRVGAGLVGIDPSNSTRLHPAMRLTAPVLQVREVPPDSYIGYGEQHRTQHATRLALVPLGYADGLPRQAEGQAQVWINGRRRRVVWAISMDQFVVELGRPDSGEHTAPGDVVTVFGPGDEGEPTVTEWARWSGTLPHAIVTGISHRVHRAWLQNNTQR